MSNVKYYIQDIETGEYLSVDSNSKIIVGKDPYVWVGRATDGDNEWRFKDSKSDGYLYDTGKEFGLVADFVDSSMWWTNAKSLGYSLANVETNKQLNRQYGDNDEIFTFVPVEQNIKIPPVE